eukprot:TRINITY_DN24198_c0_g1_i2.p1 TRINITY_DN24198_c0_g1~~TRINITY_DN24198_c0_g1_i2.p1  ORF type:complete len:759 (-),score=188.83 TRINITY_DN24198_c0_g1_i2:16-2292(-)
MGNGDAADGSTWRPGAAAWIKDPRHTSGSFEVPPAPTETQALAEYARRQVQLCQRHTQEDLDGLHDQIHEEMHKAVTQELRGVAAEVNRVRKESMDALRKALKEDVSPLMEELSRVLTDDIGPLRAQVQDLSAEVAKIPASASAGNGEGDLEALRAEVQSLREDARELREQSPKAAQEVMMVLQAVEAKSREAATEIARSVSAEAAAEAAREAARDEVQVVLEAREAAQQSIKMAEAELTSERWRSEAAELRTETQALEERLASMLEGRLEALVDTERLEAHVSAAVEELNGELQMECAERLKLIAQVDAARARSEQVLEHLGQLSEVRFQETQEAVADLERRQSDALREATESLARRSELQELSGRAESLAGRTSEFAGQLEGLMAQCGDLEAQALVTASKVSTLARSVAEDKRGSAEVEELRAAIRDVSQRCDEGLGVAKAGWARSIEWAADISKLTEAAAASGDAKKDGFGLDADGSLTSPPFAAACQTGLQLRLQLVEGVRGWVVGAFLRAPAGRISFRIHAAGKTQTFEAAIFGRDGAPEWGSPRIATLSTLPSTKLTVKLDILEVSLAVPAAPSAEATNGAWWPPGIAGVARVTDEGHAAAREAASIRAGMVRRVEWRLTRVSERLEVARRAFSAGSPIDDEALEPWVTPPFAAAGLEGLRLHIYPLGYRPRGDEMCGFFLSCPKGVFVRCRLFVGDAFRVFEHSYDTRSRSTRWHWPSMDFRHLLKACFFERVGLAGVVTMSVIFLTLLAP